MRSAEASLSSASPSRITNTRCGSLTFRSIVVAATASGGATIAPIVTAAAQGMVGTSTCTTKATAAVVNPTAMSARLITGAQWRFKSRSEVS
jgi:hypothetical protein